MVAPDAAGYAPALDRSANGMRILMLLAIVPTFLAAAVGRVERVNFDLGAPSRQIAITATEGLDTSIEASIRSDGALYDVRDWTVLLWYGTASTNPPIGLAFTNTASGRGWARWDIDGAMLATNGRFDVQIVASHSDGTIQDWARGYMTIRADSTSTFQPVTFGAPLHAVSNALAAAIAVASTNLQAAIDAEALARASGDLVAMTNWQAVVYSLTNGAALGATAWQNPANAADWTWTSNGREITLTGYSGPNAVVIPDMLDGLPVTGFGEVFSGNYHITSVGGGANIKAIGTDAFLGCSALNSVSLTACNTVGDSAFDLCIALNSVFLPACTTVGTGAFYGCSALNSVSLTACNTVGDSAFYDCKNLTSVSLPACTTVGDSAFAGCDSLNSVTLPACTTVGNAAFFGCGNLSSVTFAQNAPAPAENVFEYSTPTIYVSNPHATGWGDTWNGRPVVRAASMADIADEISTHNILAHNIYTPIIPATTTIAITSTQCIYSTTFASAGTITQSIAGLNVSGTQEARWELWVNATNPDALAPTWQANLDWQNGTPEMTVTGLYKFAMSTTGGRITGRQTYPTIHPAIRLLFSVGANGAAAPTMPLNATILGTTETTNAFWFALPNPVKQYYLTIEYATSGESTVNTVMTFCGYWVHGVMGGIVSLQAHKNICSSGLERESVGFMMPTQAEILLDANALFGVWSTSPIVRLGVFWTRASASSANVYLNGIVAREANELEIKAYNAGWRP